MIEPKVGKTYRVYHSRKGRFEVRIDKIDDDCVDCTIVKGEAVFLASDNRSVGESITMRKTMCFFVELKE